MTVLAAVVAATLVLGVTPVFAAPAAPGAPAVPDEAAQFKEHFERGQVNYDLKEYAAALEEFKSAYRYRQDPVMLYNIAQCHFFLGNNEEALGFYRNYLRRAPEAPNKTAVERKIQDLERRIASAPKSATPAPASPPPLAPAAPAAREPVPGTTPSAPAPVTLTPPGVVETAPAKSVVDLSTPAPPPAESRSIFGRWWFWTGVGVVLLGGLAAASAAGKRSQVGDCMGYSPCNKVGGP